MASNLAKISDISLHLQCSIENSVLSTKTYISELVILSILSLEIAKIEKKITDNEYNTIWEDLTSLPKNIQTHLLKSERFRNQKEADKDIYFKILNFLKNKED